MKKVGRGTKLCRGLRHSRVRRKTDTWETRDADHIPEDKMFLFCLKRRKRSMTVYLAVGAAEGGMVCVLRV